MAPPNHRGDSTEVVKPRFDSPPSTPSVKDSFEDDRMVTYGAAGLTASRMPAFYEKNKIPEEKDK